MLKKLGSQRPFWRLIKDENQHGAFEDKYAEQENNGTWSPQGTSMKKLAGSHKDRGGWDEEPTEWGEISVLRKDFRETKNYIPRWQHIVKAESRVSAGKTKWKDFWEYRKMMRVWQIQKTSNRDPT